MTPLVTFKPRTMIVFRWGGRSQWLKADDALRMILADRNRKKRSIAYIVRCKPRTRRCRELP